MNKLNTEQPQDLTEEQTSFFAKLKSEFNKPKRRYLYNIVHQMNKEHQNCYVAINLTPAALCGLIAYIEQVGFDITYACSYSFTEMELMTIINKFYTKVIYLQAAPSPYHYEIDLYPNWEYHSGYPYEKGMPELYKEGLLEFIQDMSIKNNWRQTN